MKRITRSAIVGFSPAYEFSNRIVAAELEAVFSRIADSTVDAFRQRAESQPDGQAAG